MDQDRIANHEFNTRWWGGPAGIVRDAGLFFAPAAERRAALEAYEWVEFRTPVASAELRRAVAQTGFVFADAEIPFRIEFAHLPERCDDPELVAAAGAFDLATAELLSFGKERYRMLPGMTEARLNERYADWARQLIRANPALSLLLTAGGLRQGYFLAEPGADGLHLTLAGKFTGAAASGAAIYGSSLRAFERMGYRAGWASFSAFNAAILNIYSRLGARFLPPVEHYVWVRQTEMPE